jgi:hypothetical protein
MLMAHDERPRGVEQLAVRQVSRQSEPAAIVDESNLGIRAPWAVRALRPSSARAAVRDLDLLGPVRPMRRGSQRPAMQSSESEPGMA